MKGHQTVGGNKSMPVVPPPRARKLTVQEEQLRKEMLDTARRFSKDPEMAICWKLGIGACFKF